jgi:hypothetical protein
LGFVSKFNLIGVKKTIAGMGCRNLPQFLNEVQVCKIWAGSAQG